MFSVFLAFVALSACLVICLNAETVGLRLGVMDYPDTTRKVHARATPLIGGIAILLPLLIWLVGALVGETDVQPLLVLMLCASGVGLVGFADDQTPTTPLSRVLSLLVFLGVAFVIEPTLIARSLNWGSFEPTILPAWAYCALMGLTTVGIVNAVNMADGQNGLVPSMFVIWSVCLAFVGDPVVSAVSQILAVSASIVLFFNLRGQLFLGDCGSYGVTFVLGLLAMMAYAQGRVTIETITVWFFIPVMDCLRLIITRRLQGRSALAPDTDHFHHRLQAKMGKHYGLGAYVASVAAFSLIAALAPRFALVCLIVLTAIYFSFAWLTDSTASLSLADSSVRAGSDVEEAFANVVSIASTEKTQARERF